MSRCGGGGEADRAVDDAHNGERVADEHPPYSVDAVRRIAAEQRGEYMELIKKKEQVSDHRAAI